MILLGQAGEIFEKPESTSGLEQVPLYTSSQSRQYAEFIAVSAGQSVHKPKNISFEEAVGIPMAGLTAWQLLAEGMNFRQGETIFIHAA